MVSDPDRQTQNMQTRSMTYRAALLQGTESFESCGECSEPTTPPSAEEREIEWDDEPEAPSADDFHDAMAEEAYHELPVGLHDAMAEEVYREMMAEQARRGARTRVRMQQ